MVSRVGHSDQKLSVLDHLPARPLQTRKQGNRRPGQAAGAPVPDHPGSSQGWCPCTKMHVLLAWTHSSTFCNIPRRRYPQKSDRKHGCHVTGEPEAWPSGWNPRNRFQNMGTSHLAEWLEPQESISKHGHQPLARVAGTPGIDFKTWAPAAWPALRFPWDRHLIAREIAARVI